MEGLNGKIQEILLGFPEVSLCVLFGSLASGSFSPSSDLDIAVAGKEALTVDRRLELIQALSEGTGREVDLVDLNTSWGPILAEVLSKGLVLVNKDRQLYARLVSRMLFNQADMMPYYERTLRERRKRFLDG